MKKVNPNSSKYKKDDLRRGVDYIGVCCIFFCHDGTGNLLMHKRSNKCRDEIGRWDCGSGSMEFGESFEEAVRREIREEYGCEVLELNYGGVSNVLRKNGKLNTHWVALLFSAKVEPGQVKIGEPDKVAEWGWYSFDNLPSPLHSALPKHLHMIKNSKII